MPAPRHLTFVLALLGLPDLAAAAAPRVNAPAPGSSPAPAAGPAASPVPKASSARPAGTPARKSSTPSRPASKPASKTARKPAADEPAKPASKPSSKTADEPAPKPASKPAADEPAKPSSKTADEPASKAAPKPASKPAAGEPAPKTASKPADEPTKPGVDEPASPVPKASKPGKPGPISETSKDDKVPGKPPAPVPEASKDRPAPASKSAPPAESAPKSGKPVEPAASAPVPEASDDLPAEPVARKRPRAARKPRPPGDPLLAAHPAASCALDPLEAVAVRQHERTRATLREFYWSDMARFFETTLDEAEPTPRQADDPSFLPAADVIAGLPRSAREPLTALAGARVVDRLSERPWAHTHRLLSSLSPADVAALLRADSPTLRAHVYTWLATTRQGGCHLGHVDLDFLEAAVADRSIAVEHGEDLVYRSLGDYALAARARLAALDPARFDALLARVGASADVDPLVRATAHGMLLRRAHWEALDQGLRDPSPPVRAAAAAAAAEMSADKLEARLVEHAAADPADLVTELVVGALLGVYDPHNHGKPQVRGLLASTRDERLSAAVARWRGRGDPLAPLPLPARPLRFAAAAPVPADSRVEPVLTDSPSAPAPAPVVVEAPPQRPSGAFPAAAAAIHEAAEPALPGRRARAQEPASASAAPARRLPGVHDRDEDET